MAPPPSGGGCSSSCSAPVGSAANEEPADGSAPVGAATAPATGVDGPAILARFARAPEATN
eukprot:10705283-Lingulodinium_polyedra.AAC.1